jgi:hypothetical protein
MTWNRDIKMKRQNVVAAFLIAAAWRPRVRFQPRIQISLLHPLIGTSPSATGHLGQMTPGDSDWTIGIQDDEP